MVFIGFGFLMSFLYQSGFTATGHAFIVASGTAMMGILVAGFWHQVFEGQFHAIMLDTAALIAGEFAAGTVLVSFGAMLGKLSATQLLCMAIIECVFYSLNEVILMKTFVVADAGGSMVIHA